MSKKEIVLSFIVVLVIILVIIGLAVFGTLQFLEKEKPEPSPTKEPSEEVVGGGFLPVEPVVWDNPEKPMESWPLEGAEIPEEAIKIGMRVGSFFPSNFEAEKGKKVVIAVTSQDESGHILKFKDPTLSNIAVGVSPDETRAITFYAPNKEGDYEFFCDVFGHREKGETGVMVVK